MPRKQHTLAHSVLSAVLGIAAPVGVVTWLLIRQG